MPSQRAPSRRAIPEQAPACYASATTGQQIVAVWGRRHQPTWTSEYEPDYSTAELPPADQIRVPAGTRALFERGIPAEAVIRAIQDGNR